MTSTPPPPARPPTPKDRASPQGKSRRHFRTLISLRWHHDMDPAEDGLPIPQRYWAILTLMVGVALSCLERSKAVRGCSGSAGAQPAQSGARLCKASVMRSSSAVIVIAP